MKTTKNIDAWRLLTELGQGGGYKMASIKLGLDFPTCTRLMQKLEAELGMELVVRNSRLVKLTTAGEYLRPAARALTEAFENALQSAMSANDVPATLRFSVPVNCPRQSIFKMIQNYAEKDSKLTVEILSDMNHEDVLTGRVDLAMLPYRPEGDGLVLWPLGKSFYVMLASPKYLLEHGTPRTPADMADHDIILRSSDYYPKTRFLIRGDEKEPLLYRRIAFSGDVMSGKEALLNGEGIAVSLSIATCWNEIESGALVPVLTDWHRPEWEMTLCMSKNNVGNMRFVNFARAFVKSESEAIRQRRKRNKALLKKFGWEGPAV